jgi:hypothetical protein
MIQRLGCGWSGGSCAFTAWPPFATNHTLLGLQCAGGPPCVLSCFLRLADAGSTTKGAVCRKNCSVVSCSTATQQSAPTLKWLISKGHFPARMAVKMHNVAFWTGLDNNATHSVEGSKCLRVFPARLREKNMENPITQRRAVGLLMVFATVLTLIAVWNLPENPGTESGEPN